MMLRITLTRFFGEDSAVLNEYYKNMRNVLFYNTAPEMEFILWGWIYAFTLLPFSIYCFKKAMPYAIERM